MLHINKFFLLKRQFPQMLVIGCAACLAAIAAHAKDAQDQQNQIQFAVSVTDGLLSVDVTRAPVTDVMSAIAQQSGMNWSAQGELGYISAKYFTDEPLANGIRKLLSENNGVLIEFAAKSAREGFYNDLLRAPLAVKVVYGEPQIVAIKVIGTHKQDAETDRKSKQTSATGPLNALPWDYNKGPESLPPAATRIAEIRKLVRDRRAAAFGPLAEVLAFDPEATVRAAAIEGLAGLETDDAWNAINGALTDSDPKVRIKALAVQKTDAAGPPVTLLGNFLQNDPSSSVRFFALNMLARYKQDSAEAYNALQQALNDTDPNVRAAADQALKK
jgi:hypothetical protein